MRVILAHPTWLAYCSERNGYHYVYLEHDTPLHFGPRAELPLDFVHAKGHSPAVMLAALVNGTRQP